MGSPAARLGPYEIVAPLGAGGMGEVYRARDPRLQREVAIKVLRDDRAGAEMVLRLEREARLVGSLNHPNVVAVYDVGTHEGAPYVVSELLEGETLRERLSAGLLPLRRTLEVALQIAQGLAAAHDKGICHRDLKPENVFLTRDGHVKILDFGLAKARSAVKPDGSTASLAVNELETDSGVVMGTAAYMSPEQVQGQEADHRSDVFSFGALLYEMLSGQRPFARSTGIETMAAILRDEPPELATLAPGLPGGIVELVRHCLEKDPRHRFQSTHDLAFQLRALSGAATTTRPGSALPAPSRAGRVSARLVAGAALAAAVLAVALMAVRRAPASLHFGQVTFQRGRVLSARFVPDGRSLVYAAAWGSAPVDGTLTLPGSREGRPLGYPGAAPLAVSASSELALRLRQQPRGADRFVGTLARVPLAGGAPRELAEGVEDADWSPDGTELAVVREDGQGGARLEFPLGHTLFATPGTLRHPRVSPDGARVAFLADPANVEMAGSVMVAGRDGTARAVSRRFANAAGLAWSADGREVWFTAAEEGANRVLRAVTLGGTERVVLEGPGHLTLKDLAPGRILLTRDEDRRELWAVSAEGATRELTWLDSSGLGDLSLDGRSVLFADRLHVYRRDLAGGPAVSLAEGHADRLSPDGRYALVTALGSDGLTAVPTGAGDALPLGAPGLGGYSGALWLPDGSGVVLSAHQAGRPTRVWRQDLLGHAPVPLSPEGFRANAVSPDGRAWAGVPLDGGVEVVGSTLAEEPPRPVPSARPGDQVVQWTADGRGLWAYRRFELPVTIFRLDLAGSARTPVRTLHPVDPAGITGFTGLRLTPDGRTVAYSYRRTLSTLFVVTGNGW